MKSSTLLAITILVGFICVVFTMDTPATARSDFLCSDVTEIPQVECEALVALYNSTNGDGWTNHTNWLVINTPSNWWGITVTSGYVTQINLFNNQLNGSIPSELGVFTNLNWLILGSNQLDGSIPAELGNLSKLQILHLASNQLSGIIPHELGKMSELNWLYLFNNQLSGNLPGSLGNLQFLSEIIVSDTNLSGPLPGNLIKLTLGKFWFSNTNLCEPPDDAFQSWLNGISDLKRTGIACSGDFFSCSSVAEIPQTECEALVSLYDGTNGPGWTYNSNWFFTNTPSSWYGIIVQDMHVSVINLPENNLIGNLPPELDNLTGLTKLHLSRNHLSGVIPPEIGNITNLEYLDLTMNELYGNIPTELGNLTHLTDLILSTNHITGSIPPQLGNLSELKVLDMDSNQLSGYIPTEMGNLTNLEILDLQFNQLSGGIPLVLSDLAHLRVLALWSNQLTGNIPVELANLASLQLLLLSYNQFSGNIPPTLGSMPSLSQLTLDHNQLTGAIPSELGNLNLWILTLSTNQLSGNIPHELGNFTNLAILDLSSNQITGTIPAELGDIGYLYELVLSDNQLSGPIPPELGNLTNLSILRLNDNRLEGDIPGTFINLTQLANPGMVWDGTDGLDLDYNMLNVPAGYPVPGDPLQTFLSQKDPEWQMYQGFEQDIGTEGGEITSLDGKTNFDIPAGAVKGTTTFTFLPQPSPGQDHPGLLYANHNFDLSASDSLGTPVVIFDQPITVTISYTDADRGLIMEDTLSIYYWDDNAGAWTDVVTTCPGGEYMRDPVGNVLSVPICHLTEFGLFGESQKVFLPVVGR